MLCSFVFTSLDTCVDSGFFGAYLCVRDTPFTCPKGSPADNSVAVGGCCETDAQCYSKSELFAFSVSYFYCIICFLVNSKYMLHQTIKQTSAALVVGMGTISAIPTYVNAK